MIQSFLYAGIQPKEGQLEQNYSQILPPVMGLADNIINNNVDGEPTGYFDYRKMITWLQIQVTQEGNQEV
jgi:hypothetical protein